MAVSEVSKTMLANTGRPIADPMLGRVASSCRYLDIDGPNMRKWLSEAKAPDEQQTGTIYAGTAVPSRADWRYRGMLLLSELQYEPHPCLAGHVPLLSCRLRIGTQQA